MKLTSDQIKESLFERLAQLNEVSDWGYITITVNGNVKRNPSFAVNVCTEETELCQSDNIDQAIKTELSKHSRHGGKSEAEKMRERAVSLLKKAEALEAKALPPEPAGPATPESGPVASAA
jgi:hypothetical protein